MVGVDLALAEELADVEGVELEKRAPEPERLGVNPPLRSAPAAPAQTVKIAFVDPLSGPFAAVVPGRSIWSMCLPALAAAMTCSVCKLRMEHTDPRLANTRATASGTPRRTAS